MTTRDELPDDPSLAELAYFAEHNLRAWFTPELRRRSIEYHQSQRYRRRTTITLPTYGVRFVFKSGRLDKIVNISD